MSEQIASALPSAVPRLTAARPITAASTMPAASAAAATPYQLDTVRPVSTAIVSTTPNTTPKGMPSPNAMRPRATPAWCSVRPGGP